MSFFNKNYLFIAIAMSILVIVNIYTIMKDDNTDKNREGYTANISSFNTFNADSDKFMQELMNNATTIDSQSSNINHILAKKPDDITEVLNILVSMKTVFEEAIDKTIKINGQLSTAINNKRIFTADDPNNPNMKSFDDIMSNMGDNGLRAVQILNKLKDEYYDSCKTVYDYSITSLSCANNLLSDTIITENKTNKTYTEELRKIMDETEAIHRAKMDEIDKVTKHYTGLINEAKKRAPEDSTFISYIGTYRDNPDRRMQLLNGGAYSFNFGTCLAAATKGKHSYFALQHGGGRDHNAQCAVSNDIRKATSLGQISDPAISKDGGYYGSGWGNSIYQITVNNKSPMVPLNSTDAQCYLNRYIDLRNAFGANNVEAAKNHWLNHGYNENRLSKC